jgi:hypothetical protein
MDPLPPTPHAHSHTIMRSFRSFTVAPAGCSTSKQCSSPDACCPRKKKRVEACLLPVAVWVACAHTTPHHTTPHNATQHHITHNATRPPNTTPHHPNHGFGRKVQRHRWRYATFGFGGGCSNLSAPPRVLRRCSTPCWAALLSVIWALVGMRREVPLFAALATHQAADSSLRVPLRLLGDGSSVPAHSHARPSSCTARRSLCGWVEM